MSFSYGGKEWVSFRKQMMKQLDSSCTFCNKELIGSDFTLDHILPVSRYPELAYEPTNIQPLCRRCNSLKRDEIESRQTYINNKYVSLNV